MNEERRSSYRRAEDREMHGNFQRQIDEIHCRVFNGLGKELRNEVKEDFDKVHRKIGTLYKSIGGLLLALLMIFAGILIEGRFTAQKASDENLRNYKAILDLELKIEKLNMGVSP
jgi:hypothetical protein